MRSPETTVERDAHLAAAAYLMKHAGATALVVINDNQDRVPVALITEGDVAGAVADGRDPNHVRISDVATGVPLTISPDATVRTAADLMLSSGVRHLPVVEGGRLVGIMDIGDACRGLMEGQHDELVG
jgi:CBS domain-containing protein